MDTDKVETPPDGTAPADADKANESYMLSFKSRDEAEHGFKEVQAAKTRAEQRAAELEKQMQQAQLEATVAKQLNDQAKLKAEADGTSVAEARTKLKAEWAEKLQGDDPADALVDLAERYSSASQRTIDATKAELKKEIENLRSQMAEVQIQQSPIYQQNQKHIEVLVKKLGCSRKAALEAFEDMAQESGLVITGAPAPGGTAGSKPISSGSSTKLRPMNDSEKAWARNQGWTEAEINAEKMAV